MHQTYEQLTRELETRSIRLSHQRLKVLEYLASNRCHPTVDAIYGALSPQISTLSKTTVYNTLHLLQEAGLVRAIAIEDTETRYDIDVTNHGHFKCTGCGEVFDFTLDFEKIDETPLSGFRIHERNVHYRGLCPACDAHNHR